VILSSHIVSDIESIADEVAIMKKGKLIIKDKQSDIIRQAEGKVFTTNIDKAAMSDFGASYKVVSSYRNGDEFKVRYISNTPAPNSESVKATLEDSYIYMTKI